MGDNPFPYLESFRDTETLASLGYHPFAVSIFDHWLTNAEADSVHLSYQSALMAGELEPYLRGDARFVALYDEIFAGGVSIVQEHGCLEPVRPGSRRAQEMVVASLRDRWVRKRHRWLGIRHMDVFLHRWNTRIIGGWDRTDWFFCRDETLISPLQAKVADAGLFVLT